MILFFSFTCTKQRIANNNYRKDFRGEYLIIDGMDGEIYLNSPIKF